MRIIMKNNNRIEYTEFQVYNRKLNKKSNYKCKSGAHIIFFRNFTHFIDNFILCLKVRY